MIEKTTAGKISPSDLSRARSALEADGVTCVLCRGETLLTDRRTGIAPLLSRAESGGLNGFSVADRIVGRAAALLLIGGGAKAVYGAVMSEGAKALLDACGIPCTCTTLTKEIRNRAGTGLCPMETAVAGTESPEEAVPLLKNAVAALKNSRKEGQQ